MLSRIGIIFMRLLGQLPLSWVRALGWVLGWVLFAVATSRRHVVRVNLRLCYPDQSPQQIRVLAVQTFIYFAQAWLDRGWLWHGAPQTVQARLRITGARGELEGQQPTVIFSPHFVGLDAGWTALTQQMPREFTTIYSSQSDKVLNAWILAGRQRFGHAKLFGRADGAKKIVSALRRGAPLYLLPDMHFSLEESVFVPFFGVPTSTLPSLSRFSRLGGAKVVPVVTRMTPSGYDVQVMPAWQNYPTQDLAADAAYMNECLQDYIDEMPAQYYWVHKRFKVRPDGAPSVYAEMDGK